MNGHIAIPILALSLVTLALVPAASAAGADVEITENYVDADLSLDTTEGDEIPVCVTKPSPDPKGEEEICVAVIWVPNVPSICIRTGPDAKADEICVKDLLQGTPW